MGRKKYLLDWAERVLWTAAEVAVASVSVSALGLPDWAVGPVTVGLAMLKGFISKNIGEKGTAGTADLR